MKVKESNSYTSMKGSHSGPSALFTFIVWFGTINNETFADDMKNIDQ
jgi:hypothetical protein